jgi:predicted RNase H-like HicB family nuclease
MKVPVYLEVAEKRAFAAAVDWPGWCRAGKDEAGALSALADATKRYGVVAKAAGLELPSDPEFEVVERVKGNVTTEFGAPGVVPELDAEAPNKKEAARLADIVGASWRVLERVVSSAPSELRKGPRGGGRDRDKVVEHVLGAEEGYQRQIGVKEKDPVVRRKAILEALRAPVADGKWPARYAARRIAWHALDHAWEIEDRS